MSAELMRLREHSPAVFLHVVGLTTDQDELHRARRLFCDHRPLWDAFVAKCAAVLPPFQPGYLDCTGTDQAQGRLTKIRQALAQADLPPLPKLPRTEPFWPLSRL